MWTGSFSVSPFICNKKGQEKGVMTVEFYSSYFHYGRINCIIISCCCSCYFHAFYCTKYCSIRHWCFIIIFLSCFWRRNWTAYSYQPIHCFPIRIFMCLWNGLTCCDSVSYHMKQGQRLIYSL